MLDSPDESNIIIAQTNNSVCNYNSMVRKALYGSCDSIMDKEHLLVIENNYSHPVHIMNGDFLKIEEIYSQESKEVKLRGRGAVKLNFRDVRVSVMDRSNKNKFAFNCKILENLLDSSTNMLTRDEKSALLVDLIQRHKEVKINSPDFKEIIKTDKYFNCLKVKYGYAITCHKSQGGEWDNVFVDLHSTKPYTSPDYRRWAYTAITRAKKSLYLMNNELLDVKRNTMKILIRMAV